MNGLSFALFLWDTCGRLKASSIPLKTVAFLRLANGAAFLPYPALDIQTSANCTVVEAFLLLEFSRTWAAIIIRAIFRQHTITTIVSEMALVAFTFRHAHVEASHWFCFNRRWTIFIGAITATFIP